MTTEPGALSAMQKQDGRRGDILPRSLPPRGLAKPEAAAYIGVSVTLFEQMVGDGRVPGAKRINSRAIWDLRALDLAFDTLPGGDAQEIEFRV